MIRNVLGSVLALVGATAAVWSPFRAWYDGRHGRDYAIDELFTGITGTKADVLGSILLPFAFAALLTLVGVVLRSRLLVALAGLVVLGFAVLWMVRVGQAEGGLVVSGGGRGLGDGVANAVGGGVLLLLGALVMAGRPRRRPRAAAPPPADRPETGTAETGTAETEARPYGTSGTGASPYGTPGAEPSPYGTPGAEAPSHRAPGAEAPSSGDPDDPYAPTRSFDVPPSGQEREDPPPRS